MFLDRPARFLYQHNRNLYTPMRVFATHYCLICRVGLTVAGLGLGYYLLSGYRMLAMLNIVRSH